MLSWNASRTTRYWIIPEAKFVDASDGSNRKIFFINGKVEVVPVDSFNRTVTGTSPSRTEHQVFLDKLINEGRLIGIDTTQHNLFSLPEKYAVVFPDRPSFLQESNIPGDAYPFHANTLQEMQGFPVEVVERNEHRPLLSIEVDAKAIVDSLQFETDPKEPFYIDVDRITYAKDAIETIQAPIHTYVESPFQNDDPTTPGQPPALPRSFFIPETEETAKMLVKKRLRAHFLKLRSDYIFHGFPAVAPTAEIETVTFDDKEAVTYVDCDWPPNFVLDQMAEGPVHRQLPYFKQIVAVPAPDTIILPGATGEMNVVLYDVAASGGSTPDERFFLLQADGKIQEPPRDKRLFVEVLNLSENSIPPATGIDPDTEQPLPRNYTTKFRVDWLWELDRWCVLPQGTGTAQAPQEPLSLPPTADLDQTIDYTLSVINNRLYWEPPRKTIYMGDVVEAVVSWKASTFTIDSLVRWQALAASTHHQLLIHPDTHCRQHVQPWP